MLEALAGTSLGIERLQEVCAAYAPMLEEIAKLRMLDLADVHPAVIFEPTAAYRRPR
jgi:hypothetical protein